MLRWLKDRKKQRKGQRSDEATPDEYGFHDGNKEEDKMYHIYEEIPDLPRFTAQSNQADQEEQSPSFRETSFSDSDPSFDHVSVFSADTLRKYIIGSQDKRSDLPVSKRDGPYMVVPLLNSGEEKPPLPPPNEKKSEFTCALVGRRHSCVSRSTESGVEVSYDSSESQGSEANFPSEQIVKVDVHNSAELNRKSCVRTHVREGSLDTSDTGCEYDMGTSSESDHTSYDYYLTKIEQNLALKLKTREIIQQSVPEEDESDSESLTTVSSVSCCSSVRAGVRLYSGHRSDIDSDDGTLADHSESENSSGYYESFNGKDSGVPGLKSCLKNSSQEHKQHYVKNKKRGVTKKCKHKCAEVNVCIPGLNSDKSCKHRSSDALHVNFDKSAFKKVNRPVYKSISNGQVTSDSGINRLYGLSSNANTTISSHTNKTDTADIKLDLYEPVEGSSLYNGTKGMTSFDSEGREVYSPPPTIRDFSPRTTTFSKCSLPRSKGCTNVYRSNGSQNRLLSDLIIMNYDRQLFIH